jgi:hypothetical protein
VASVAPYGNPGCVASATWVSYASYTNLDRVSGLGAYDGVVLGLGDRVRLVLLLGLGFEVALETNRQ